jgi:hypothetical protein
VYGLESITECQHSRGLQRRGFERDLCIGSLAAPAMPGTPLYVKRTGWEPSCSPGRPTGMAWDPKVLKVARILLRKHGTDALGVAQQRADEWSERGEQRAANLWRVIGSAVLAILNRVRRTTGRRATLPEVLHGSVTQKVMDADKVERRHVERLMRRAKRRRASNDL